MSLTKVSYSMINGASVNVLDYGADPTGIADSTVAIQGAITAAGAGTVIFPDGTFSINGTLTVPVGCKIQGTYRLGQNGNATGTSNGTKIVQTATGTAISPTIGTTFGDITGNYGLTVLSAAGMSIGSVITIAGAGVNGATLYARITNIVGVTITLDSVWSTAVISAVTTVQVGVNIFELHNTGYDNTGTTLDILGNSFEGLWLDGGYDQISAKNGGVWVTLNNLSLVNAKRSAVYFAGFVQQWFTQNIETGAGPYGFLYGGNGVSLANNLFDKNRFYNTYLNGHSINGVNIVLLSGTGQASYWITTTINYCTQDGFVLGGPVSDFGIIGLNTESNGYTNSVPTPPTTGSITSGTPTLVVASATGLATGQTVTVKGAGLFGNDLISRVIGLVGTTLTLGNNASTTVSAQEVVNYPFSDLLFKANPSGSTPNNCNLYSCVIGTISAVAAVRYALDAASQVHTISGCNGTRPITALGSIIGDSRIPIRQISNAFNNFSNNSAPTSEALQSQFVSPPGTNIALALQALDSATATGFGQWQGYVANPNRTKIWAIDGTTGTASFSGVAPGNGYTIGVFSTQRIFYASGTPQATAPWSTAAWIVGDRAFNSAPVIGSPKGWLCTVAGTPGTWVSDGNL